MIQCSKCNSGEPHVHQPSEVGCSGCAELQLQIDEARKAFQLITEISPDMEYYQWPASPFQSAVDVAHATIEKLALKRFGRSRTNPWCVCACHTTGKCSAADCGCSVIEKRNDEVCWFAEVNQESKAACSVCKDLTWPRWYAGDGDHLTDDPNEAKRFDKREQALEFCTMTHVRHWHLYPTEHMFVS